MTHYDADMQHGTMVSFLAANLPSPIPSGSRLLMRYPSHPPIACICGSGRFRAEILALRDALTREGYIVVGPEVTTWTNDEEKRALDEMHLRKIDMADSVWFVNPGNYWGESTTREYNYAHAQGKALHTSLPGTPDASDAHYSGA